MIRLRKENKNSPEYFNTHFRGLSYVDMKRQEKLASRFRGGIYVDIGCWDSPMPVLIADKFQKSKIYALDYAFDVIDELSREFPKVRYTYISDCCNLPFVDNSVDYIVAGELIEHLDNPKLFIREALRVLKVNGTLAISTPKDEAHGNKLGGDLHIWSFDEDDMKELLTDCELSSLKEGNYTSWIAFKIKK